MSPVNEFEKMMNSADPTAGQVRVTAGMLDQVEAATRQRERHQQVASATGGDERSAEFGPSSDDEQDPSMQDLGESDEAMMDQALAESDDDEDEDIDDEDEDGEDDEDDDEADQVSPQGVDLSSIDPAQLQALLALVQAQTAMTQPAKPVKKAKKKKRSKDRMVSSDHDASQQTPSEPDQVSVPVHVQVDSSSDQEQQTGEQPVTPSRPTEQSSSTTAAAADADGDAGASKDVESKKDSRNGDPNDKDSRAAYEAIRSAPPMQFAGRSAQVKNLPSGLIEALRNYVRPAFGQDVDRIGANRILTAWLIVTLGAEVSGLDDYTQKIIDEMRRRDVIVAKLHYLETKTEQIEELVTAKSARVEALLRSHGETIDVVELICDFLLANSLGAAQTAQATPRTVEMMQPSVLQVRDRSHRQSQQLRRRINEEQGRPL